MKKLFLAASVFAASLVCSGAMAETPAVSVVYSFNAPTGNYPTARLTAVGGLLYGTASQGGAASGIPGGVLFSFNPTTAAYKMLYSFGNVGGGRTPQSPVIDVGGSLYGTTGTGGSVGGGVVYSYNLSSHKEAVVGSFNTVQNVSQNAALVAVGSMLYGTDPIGGGSAKCKGCGFIFSVNTVTKAVKTVHLFQGPPDGAYPQAGLLNVGGTLYGTTKGGGNTTSSVCKNVYPTASGCGSVFSYNPATGVEKTVFSFTFSFDDTSGFTPYSSLIDLNGHLVGTVLDGFSYALGGVFSIDLSSGAEKAVYSLKSRSDIFGLYSDLINVHGLLYGTSLQGGVNGQGTVFSLNPANGTVTIIHSFGATAKDGSTPQAGLTYSGGKIYGTTYQGGAYGTGTIFAFTP